jgi:hypothetical protein
VSPDLTAVVVVAGECQALTVVIEDLVVDFVEFAGQVPGGDVVTGWRERVVEPRADVYRAIEPWLDPADASTTLPALLDRRQDLLARSGRAHVAIREAHAVLTAAMPDAGPIQAVVLVGLGRANGWATPIDGTPTLFMAVERLPDPGYDVVLALHEMIHAGHQHRAAHDWPAHALHANLFREGLAVHATDRLMPTISASGHLWFAPGMQPWIDRCQTARAFLRQQMLSEWHRDDPTAERQWFSGAPDRAGDLPGRCGYWLGWDLMDSVLTHVPLDTAMTWPLAEATGRLHRQLETLASQ